MTIRGISALLAVAVSFCACDLIGRTVIPGLIRLRPGARQGILDGWSSILTRMVFVILRGIGGARIDRLSGVPLEPDVLVVMNHQSLLDIPVVFELFEGRSARVVTRKRYGKGIPLVSHMLRLYEHPLVEPGKNANSQLETLRAVAATTTRPVVIFPEGSRTRDGEIRPFRTAGLEALLSVKPWRVYVVVVDGFWRSARLKDFAHNVSSIHGRVESRGPFAFSPQHDDAPAFMATLRDEMCDTLRHMRTGKAKEDLHA